MTEVFSTTFRAGYIAVLGLPNAGKSTFLNSVLGEKLSIVSRRPQTTRKNLVGILNDPTFQMIFVDTPGILVPEYDLQRTMMRNVRTAIEDADVILYLVDVAQRKINRELIKEHLDNVEKPLILGLNKIDLLERAALLPIIADLSALRDFRAVIPVSALKSDGTSQIITEMAKLLPLSPPYYPTDQISDQQVRFFVAEIIREKVFRLYSREIPYACHVEIETFEEHESGKDFIRATIVVERKSQKGIVIGKKGEALKRVSTRARQDIERFTDRQVFLELHVKVVPNWRQKAGILNRMGY